jgi:acyl-CoA synthetase (NDP forming)
MKHRLDPLLRPRSVAIVGASNRPDSMGEWALRNLGLGGYRGNVYPVNPAYESLQGHRCFAAISDLPETPDLVIFALGDARIEAALDDVISAGIPAAVIQSTLFVDNDSMPACWFAVRMAWAFTTSVIMCGRAASTARRITHPVTLL